jgi:tetratricopeptide (TPR) repeat protein
MEKFPISKFLGLWQKSIHSAIIQFLDHTKINKPIESSNLINGSEKPLMPSYYKNIRKDILSIVPSDAKNILEIGCAAGMTGNELKKKSGVYVAGVELDHNAAIEAKSLLDDVIEGDIEDIDLPYKNETFDCLLFADILEHLKDPLTVLKKTSKLLKPTGTLIASIPNVQYLGVVSQLIEGNWTYQDEGILDRTHLRFFTYHEIEKLFTDAGYEIIQVHETLDPQYDSAKDTITTLNIGRLSIRDLSPEELRKFFVFQYKISAKLISDNKPKERFSKIKESKMSTTLMLGKSFEDEGKYQDAVKLYSEVGKDQDDYSEILARLGNCFMQLQDPSNAEHNYKKSLELNSDGYVAGVGLGVLELQLNKLNDSIKRFTVLSEKYPDSDKVFSGLGMAYKESRNIKKSIDSFNMALSINIENKSAMSNLLELSYNQNSFDLVEMAMKKYLKINPANTDILIGLAGILFKTNRIDDSRDILSKILEINPIHEDAKDMFNQIESQTEGVY